MSRWTQSTALALGVFAILYWLDLELKAATGVGTADLASLSSATQFRAAFWAWSAQPYATRAGFNLGFDYLLMPLYAASFFYSGIVTAEGFAPRPGGLRRIILMAAMVAPVGALADAAENGLQLTMLLFGATDTLAWLSSTASTVKNVAMMVGLVLLLGAVMARISLRKARKSGGDSGPKIPGLL